MSESVDPRLLRSRTELHRAVLELAAERPVAGLSVTAIAQRAGVHRSTFYEHAANPAQLLQAALAVELDDLRERHLRDISPEALPTALDAVTRGVFEHVDRHAAVYRRLDEAGGVALQSFLSGHFQESSRLLLEQGALDLGLLPRPGQRDAAIRFVADGIVGVISVWLHTSAPRDPEAPLDLLHQLLPPWWKLTS